MAVNGDLAERAGFEPALQFPVNTLSRRAPSTTRPPLRVSLDAFLHKQLVTPLAKQAALRSKFGRTIGTKRLASIDLRPFYAGEWHVYVEV